MSAEYTPQQRTAIQTAKAALLLSPHPVSDIVEQIVTALDTAGLLSSPETAREIREVAHGEAADFLENVGETNAAYLLRTCDVERPDVEVSPDEPIPYLLKDDAADASAARLRGLLSGGAL